MSADHDDENEEEQRVTAHSYGALNVALAGEDCWLIRIPPKLAELWDQAPEGADLGQLVFTKGGASKQERNFGPAKGIKPSLTVHVSETLAQEYREKQQREAAAAIAATSSNLIKNESKLLSSASSATSHAIPLNYSLAAMTKKIPTMHPFIRNPRNGSITILGNISRTANLQVEQDSNYRALLKDRLVATNVTSSRFVKPVEANESVISKSSSNPTTNANAKTFGNAVFKFGKRMLEAAQDSKLNASSQNAAAAAAAPNKKARQFAADQPIRSVIFELFGQQQYWTVKDLKAAAVAGGATTANTKRAEAEMRDVLREIGEYHRSGDHKNMWELRKEFQHAT